MTWLVVALVVTVLYGAFAWSFARMAAISDRRMREMFEKDGK